MADGFMQTTVLTNEELANCGRLSNQKVFHPEYLCNSTSILNQFDQRFD